MVTRIDAVILLILCLIVVGAFIPALISSFVDVGSPNMDSLVYYVTVFFTSDYNPVYLAFHYLVPSALNDYYVNSWNSFTYLPDYISVPLLLFLAVLCIVTIVFAVGGS